MTAFSTTSVCLKYEFAHICTHICIHTYENYILEIKGGRWNQNY